MNRWLLHRYRDRAALEVQPGRRQGEAARAECWRLQEGECCGVEAVGVHAVRFRPVRTGRKRHGGRTRRRRSARRPARHAAHRQIRAQLA